MAINFPTSLDAITNPDAAGGDTLLSVPHDAQHGTANDILEALEAKVGIDSSAVTTSHDYLLAGLETDKANVDQTMYIGTTAVAINRASATLNLAGIGTLGCGAITSTGALELGANTITCGGVLFGRTGSARGDDATITDNNFTTITPNRSTGVLLIFYRNLSGVDTTSEPIAMINYDLNGAVGIASLYKTANVELATGALDGTTGNDGKFTISVHTDGKIYLENRLGGSKYIGIQLIAAD